MLEKNLDKNRFYHQSSTLMICDQANCVRPAFSRYLNIGAIEAFRVRINSSTNGSDYINANYIDVSVQLLGGLASWRLCSLQITTANPTTLPY